MRLTSRGRWLALGAVASALTGRVFGLRELVVAGFAAAIVLVTAALRVGTRRVHLSYRRVARPPRVPAGGLCRIELTVANEGRRREGVVTLIDPISTGGEARLQLAPLAAGSSCTVPYRLAVERRGIVDLGPMKVELSDPFGLLTRTIPSSSRIAVVVLPAVVPLTPLPASVGAEPDARTWSTRHLATATEEFTALREYVPGDDVRKVHWPSTARHGDPIVRQMEEPWQRRCTVVLDTRPGHHHDAGFELAVSATASLLDLTTSRGELCRLVTTDGRETAFIGDRHGLDAAMDLLAGLQPREGSITGTMRRLAVDRVGGALVSVIGRLPPSETATLRSIGDAFHLHVVICCEPESAAVDLGPHAVLATSIRPGELAASWAAAVTDIEGQLVRGGRR